MKKTIFPLVGLVLLLNLGTPSIRAEDDLHTIYQEGRAAFFAGQFDLAREKLSIVLAKNPSHPQTRAMMAQIEQQLGADNTMLRKSYEKVIIERFEVNDAELSEALQALRILAGKASGGKVIPNIILKDPALGKKNITLNLTKIPLSEALNYLAQLTGAKISYDKMAVLISSPAG
ncbi:MAG: hypothetical protein WCN98_11120 [Verrucomicrobiaceae bacterium]